MDEKIGVIGLGYVGLPVAIAFARRFRGTVGFDVSNRRITELGLGNDWTGETSSTELRSSGLRFSCNPADLGQVTFFVVAVPTPVDGSNRPDLTPVVRASETVGRALKPGAVVVYESTVYPGVTEEICGPVLEAVSGLKCGVDFNLGYSPERINPGDREHTLERIVKVVSGQDGPTLERVAAAYGAIIEAGVHRAPSIKVAEAAKVIENAQRDINIAFMNELALIFDRMGIRTKDVLEAARTKWNFLPFSPGLVGGHCIGVDPYYLTHKAEELGYQPQVILAGRRINDDMGAYIGHRTAKKLAQRGRLSAASRVGILGLTFKEDVSDLRNSRVPDIVQELREFGVEPIVHDPVVDRAEAMRELEVQVNDLEALNDLDALIFAVPHRSLLELPVERLCGMVRDGGVLVDVKSVVDPTKVRKGIGYWSL